MPARLVSWLLTMLLWCCAARANADEVVMFPVEGRADVDTRAEVETALGMALQRLGHRRAPTPGGIRAARPASSAELDGVALAARARYVVVPSIESMPGQYRLHLTVGHDGRVEELLVQVERAAEGPRLDDVLRCMLRPDGLGDDALRLSGEESPADRSARLAAEERARAEAAAEAERVRAQQLAEAQRAEEARIAALEAQRRQAEADEHRRAEEARARAAREAAEAEARARRAWDERPRLGHEGPWGVFAGVLGEAIVPLGTSGPPPTSGMVRPPQGALAAGAAQVRITRIVDGVSGLELRGGLDLVFGGTSGLGVLLGGTYAATPWQLPVHVGATVELGVNGLFTGPRDVGFVARLSGFVGVALGGAWALEVTLPELGFFTNGPGAITIGASARLGLRFR